MTLHQLVPRRLSVLGDDDVAYSQMAKPYTPLGQLQSDFDHMLPVVNMEPVNYDLRDLTVDTGS